MLQRTGEAETITTHYLFALGAYRALYIPNWIYRYFFEVPRFFDPIAVIAGIIQTILYSDFFWIYYTKCVLTSFCQWDQPADANLGSSKARSSTCRCRMFGSSSNYSCRIIGPNCPSVPSCNIDAPGEGGIRGQRHMSEASEQQGSGTYKAFRGVGHLWKYPGGENRMMGFGPAAKLRAVSDGYTMIRGSHNYPYSIYNDRSSMLTLVADIGSCLKWVMFIGNLRQPCQGPEQPENEQTPS